MPCCHLSLWQRSPLSFHFPCIWTPAAPLTVPSNPSNPKAGAGHLGQTVSPSSSAAALQGLSEHPVFLIWNTLLGGLCLKETWQTLGKQTHISAIFKRIWPSIVLIIDLWSEKKRRVEFGRWPLPWKSIAVAQPEKRKGECFRYLDASYNRYNWWSIRNRVFLTPVVLCTPSLRRKDSIEVLLHIKSVSVSTTIN